jgi:phosphatidate cytidylyltransferase
MKTRVLTGIALAVPAAYLIGWAPKWLFVIALIGLCERGLYEYFSIARQSGVNVLAWAGYAMGAAICLAWPFGSVHPLVLAVAVGSVLLIPSLAIWLARDLTDYLTTVATTLWGLFYVAFGLSCVYPLRFFGVGSRLASGRQILFFLICVIVAGDVCAYLTGKLIGHRLLCPRISPKKTVEGSLGGFAAAVFVGWAYARVFWRTSDWKTAILLAGCIAVAGQLGDLAESALKRGANLKDSGGFLPGHGGLLDRIDSLLFGAPLMWLALLLEAWAHK